MSLNLNSQIEIRENEPLFKHSTFKIGGPAKYAIYPKSKEEMILSVKAAKNSGMKYFIVGNGSNLLFDDNGYSGIIIFTKFMTDTQYIHKNNCVQIKVGCGKMLTELSSEAGKKHCLTGLEFAYGIPGTVGGAVFMNAGAYGGQMSDIVFETEYYDSVKDETYTLSHTDHCFDYRNSFFNHHPEYIILSTTLEMKEGNPEDILAVMNKNMSARKEKQPLEYPSAGSTFKRPGGGLFAGKLIEDAGLKGYWVGGAQISEKHAGFTVNIGEATSADVLAVMEHTKKTVFDRFGVSLESEIIYIPD